jgi:hypothetical protein
MFGVPDRVLVADAVNSDNCSTRMGEWWKDMRQYLLSRTWSDYSS